MHSYLVAAVMVYDEDEMARYERVIMAYVYTSTFIRVILFISLIKYTFEKVLVRTSLLYVRLGVYLFSTIN